MFGIAGSPIGNALQHRSTTEGTPSTYGGRSFSLEATSIPQHLFDILTGDRERKLKSGLGLAHIGFDPKTSDTKEFIRALNFIQTNFKSSTMLQVGSSVGSADKEARRNKRYVPAEQIRHLLTKTPDELRAMGFHKEAEKREHAIVMAKRKAFWDAYKTRNIGEMKRLLKDDLLLQQRVQEVREGRPKIDSDLKKMLKEKNKTAHWDSLGPVSGKK